MHRLHNGSIAVIFMVAAIPGLAQSPGAAQPGNSTAARRAARAARVQNSGTPCWKQAGMTPAMVNQRWKMEDEQKVKIASVCTEPSTSPQQKHDKIDQIHAETALAMSQLIPSKELAAFNKCQAELDGRRPKVAGQKELGPCGGVIPASTAAEGTPGSAHNHANAPAN